ncbi:DUF418 domain-containing protein [Actinoplanes sp. TBRC 11911]|uniref:DUF418 domain-containing protein n=1 Tax=Actinoplanes sp. TBRC 11911 TaxID=2729386 RepID=UPI00145F73B4|nr:DUF418 domain-containing protein [Actinoplanes sp. TBRC 11911]NMO55385.1 DUF418 domain-containing protein [Actinoplanes sp. TBRC 11911]
MLARDGRLVTVDALRGFALLGIIIVNLPYAASGYNYAVADPTFVSVQDEVVRWLILVFCTMKFNLLFSFLFGYSFVLQQARSGPAFVPRMWRRLGVLFIFGIINMIFLVTGDILTTYAVWGAVLLVLRDIGNRTAVALILASYILIAGVGLAATLIETTDDADTLDRGATAARKLAGGVGSVLSEHLTGLPLYSRSELVMRGIAIFAAFLIGVLAARHRLLEGLDRRERIIRWAGIPLGLAGGIFYASAGGDTSPTGILVSVLTAPLLAAAYAAGVMRIVSSGRGRWLGSVLARAGRLSLSNYLGQSLITLFLFTGLGLGLVGRLSPFAMLVTAMAIFISQVAISNIWLRKFRYGPAEWLVHRVVQNRGSMAWPPSR